MNVIINADDLGYSKSVNDRIFGLIETGHVTSATLLINAPAFEDAAKRIASYPQASFGIHLNVTEFGPVSSDPAVKPLLDSNGAFHPETRRRLAGFEFKNAIHAEWRAQIRRALDFKIPLSHLDSHHHMHTDPTLFTLLMRMQREFGIRKVRRSRNVLGMGETMSPHLRAAKFLWNNVLSVLGTRTTDGFCGFQAFHSRLPGGLPNLKSIELMCHPGNPDSESETRLIEGPWRAGREDRIRLISYNAL